VYSNVFCFVRDVLTSEIESATPYAPSEAQKKQIQKHQAVFSLDFDTWKELIDVFNITESIIPHREEQEEETGRGWHG
jgi:hypothetical protein